MEPVVIMSKEFQEALQKEISTICEVIENYDPDENIFDGDDYKRYLDELIQLKDWLITE